MFEITKKYIRTLEEKVQDDYPISIDNLVELHNNINEDVFQYDDDPERSLQEMEVDAPNTLPAKLLRMRNAEKCMYDVSIRKGLAQVPAFVQKKINELSEKLNNADKELKDLGIKLKKMEEQEKTLQETRGALVEKEKAYKDVSEKISENKAKIEELEKVDLDALRKQKQKYESDFNKRNEEFITADSELKKAKQDYEMVENNLQEATEEKKKKEAEKGKLEKRYKETVKRIEELPDEIKKLERDVDEQESIYEENTKKLEEEKKNLQDKLEEIKVKERGVDEDIKELSGIYKMVCDDKVVIDLYSIDGAQEILKVDEDGRVGILPRTPQNVEELNLWFDSMEKVIKELIYIYGKEYKKILDLIVKRNKDIDK